MKVSLVGVGHVGSTLAYTLMLKGLAEELMLIDHSTVKARSDAEDLKHAMALTDHIIPINSGELNDSIDSDIVIISASTPWQKDFTSRYDLAAGNNNLFKDIIPIIAHLSPNAILIIITNPVDLMTYLAIKYSGFPSERVMGVGTLIDSARFRKTLSEKYHIHPDDIRAYILGEHGDTQFAAFSAAYIGGVKIEASEQIDRLKEVSEIAAHDIVKGKGYTNYAISMATSLIVESIVKNQNRTMPISCLTDGYLGLNDICLSVPVVVGRNGITKKLLIALDEKEQMLFKKSALRVRNEMEKLIE
jgi:L-lactate dehydrogenase